MDRRRWMLQNLDVERLQGIEIGPLTSPIVTPDIGRILYVDHADSEALRRKYKDHPAVDVARIVEVDAVWGNGNSLRQAVGEAVQADYVLASHVIEHVPDLLGWLAEIHEVLRPGGELRLIVPDRRFTFDRLRQETRFSDIVYAHTVAARAPLPLMIMDHLLEVAHVDPKAAWAGTIDDGAISRMHDLSLAQAVALDALRNGTYHDVHCWTFTPASFVALMARAAALGLLRFECTGLHETEVDDIEFFVGLRRSEVPADVISSWQQVHDKLGSGPSPRIRVAPGGDPAPGSSLAASLSQISIDLEKAVTRLSLIDPKTTSHVRGLVRAAAAGLARFARPGSR